MTMNTLQKKKFNKGLSLLESVVVLGILGTVLSGVVIYQQRAEASQARQSAVTALVNTAVEARQTFGLPTNGNYAGVTNANLVSSGLVITPFTGSGSNITTPWSTPLTSAGNVGAFAVQFSVPDSGTCNAVVSRLGSSAARIVVNTTAATLGGVATVGETLLLPGTGSAVVKASAGAAYDAANAATACNAAGRFIGVAWN